MSFESYNILNFDFMSLINLVQRDIMSYKEVLRVTRVSSTLYLCYWLTVFFLLL